MTNLIVEIGQNHLGDENRLNKIVDELIEIHNTIGSFIVKFQYWNPRRVYMTNDIRYDSAINRIIEFNAITSCMKRLHASEIETCISFFGATYIEKEYLFDTCGYIKYASSEYDEYINDKTKYKELLNYKRIILSDGFYNNIKCYSCLEFLLACVAEYPSKSADIINKVDFNKHNGISCHSEDLDAMKYAIDHNMYFAEKHYCLAEDKKNNDFRDLKGSITRSELILLLDYIKHKDSAFIQKTFNNKRTLKL